MPPRIAIPLPTSSDPEYNERAWPQYAHAVSLAGGEPVPVPLDQPPAATQQLLDSCAGILLPGSGADVDPTRYGATPDPRSAAPDPVREQVDQLLLEHAQSLRKPIFTICFGTQMLNVWRGGTLIQDLPTVQPESPVNHKAGRTIAEAHAAEIAPNSLLAQILAPAITTPSDGERDRVPSPDSVSAGSETSSLRLAVNSSHHQAIATPGQNLRIVARSSDDNVIEAIEATQTAGLSNPFLLGVQWHPERTCDSSPASRALFARFVAEARAWSASPQRP